MVSVDSVCIRMICNIIYTYLYRIEIYTWKQKNPLVVSVFACSKSVHEKARIQNLLFMVAVI